MLLLFEYLHQPHVSAPPGELALFVLNDCGLSLRLYLTAIPKRTSRSQIVAFIQSRHNVNVECRSSGGVVVVVVVVVAAVVVVVAAVVVVVAAAVVVVVVVTVVAIVLANLLFLNFQAM